MNGKVKTAVIVFAVLVISAAVSFIAVVAAAGKSDKIFPGVLVKGIHLGNKTRDEARNELAGYVSSLKDKTVAVTFEGGSGEFKLADIGLQADTNQIMDKAWAVGRKGNFLAQWQDRKDIAKIGREIPVEFSFDKNKLRSILDNLTKEVRIPPRDAKIIVTPYDTVQIMESSNGKGINLEDAADQVKGIINENSNPEIALDIIDLKPAQATVDLANLRVNGEIARFTTAFDIKKTNRVFNIKVAAEALDGQMIKPGQTFSFNKVVGPRSQEAGYKMAPTILNNEFIDSLGGGVCQVSTTLYNALLKADVEILQRSSHSLTIKYVPLGQDAAVAYGGKDLRFRNNLPSAIVIKSIVSGNTVTFKLFGDTALKKDVRIVNNIIKEYPFQIIYKDDATLVKGTQHIDQKGAKGYRVVSKKFVYQYGQMVGQKSLPGSYYAPLNEIILVGTKPTAGRSTSGNVNTGGTKPPATPTTVPEKPVVEPPAPLPPDTATPPADTSVPSNTTPNETQPGTVPPPVESPSV